MREDVIAGVLDLYCYESTLLPVERLPTVRKLVRGTMLGVEYSPWKVHELNSLIEIESCLDADENTVNEALDIAIVSVWDMHNINWADGWGMSYRPKIEKRPFDVRRKHKRDEEFVFCDCTCEDAELEEW